MIKLIDLFKYTIFLTLVVFCNCKLSDLRLCADSECKTQISNGVTTIKYMSPDSDILSFPKNVRVKIFSKSAGSNPNLWGVNIQNREGYIPFKFITETTIFVGNNDLKHIVSTKVEPISTDVDVDTKLKGSESEKVDILPTTTTAPLPIDDKTEIVTKDVLNSSGELPVEASVVQREAEIVDGTLLPINEDVSNSLETPKTIDEKEKITTEKVVLTTAEDKHEETTEMPFQKIETNKVDIENIEKNHLKSESKISLKQTTENDYISIEDDNEDTTTMRTTSSYDSKNSSLEEEEEEEEYDDEEYDDEDENENENDVHPNLKTLPTELKAKKEIPLDKNLNKNIKAEIKENVKHNTQSTSASVETSNDTNESKFYSPEINTTNESLKFSSGQQLKSNVSEGEPISPKVASKSSEVPQNQVPEMNENPVLLNKESEKNELDSSQNSIVLPTVNVPESQFLESTVSSNIETENNMDASNKNTDEEIIESSLPKNPESSENEEVIDNKLFEEKTINISSNNETDILNNKIVPETVDSSVLTDNSNSKEAKVIESKIPENNKKTFSDVNTSEIDIVSQSQLPEKNTIKNSLNKESRAKDSKYSNEILNKINNELFKENSKKESELKTNEAIPPTVPDFKSIETLENIKNIVPEKIVENNPELKPYQINPVQPGQTENSMNINPDSSQLVQDTYSQNEALTTTPGYEDNNDVNIIFDTTTSNPNLDSQSSLPLYISPEVVSTTDLPSSLTESYSTKTPDTLQTPTVQSNNDAEIISERTKVNLNDNKVEEKTGLFPTILETVKSFWSASGNDKPDEKVTENFDTDLEKILYPSKFKTSSHDQSLPQPNQKQDVNEGYCDKVSPYDCPKSAQNIPDGMSSPTFSENCVYSAVDILDILIKKLLEMFDLLICMGIAAITSLLFCFGYYCICHTRKESSLLSKLNIVERNFLASIKETSILKHELVESKTKLVNIENSSFGSNDMVIALKKDLEISEDAKQKLIEQVASLEKELETAAEAGLELNKIVSELLNNQSGDESIISSVEELQKQLNEQQNTILEINAILADKSRENSELQLILAENRARFESENESLKQDNEELENEKTLIQTRLDGLQNELMDELDKALNGKNAEIQLLQQDNSHWQSKYDEVYTKWQSSMAKIKGLEEYLEVIKENSTVNMSAFMEVAGKKVDLLAVEKERDIYKERLEELSEMKKLQEDQLKILRNEMEKLKQESNQNEKDKLEAQTRLEVLSNYFRDKETQLQKELSVKEAMWMKQQGETTSHVERVRNMQEEIQSLRSQNDSLRAEIEAQNAAHKAQIGTLENRAHESWLAARQSERKFEEARSEAASFRRKLTSLAGNANNLDLSRLPNSGVDGLIPSNDLNNAPSPIHMESPGASILGVLPPPPVLPPPFMVPPPPHFMPMPPFMPPGPGEMRPPPVGRLMSPPPPPRHHGRYSPSIIDDDDDDDHRDVRHNHHHHHHRGRYSPRNGRYSPDDHYDDDKYNTEITYDTETDFSPPPSPHSRGGGGYDRRERDRDRERDRVRDRDRDHEREQRNRGSRAGSFKAFSPPPTAPTQSSSTNSNSQDRNKKTNKGVLSSGSEQSYDSRKGKGLV